MRNWLDNHKMTKLELKCIMQNKELLRQIWNMWQKLKNLNLSLLRAEIERED